MLALSKIRMEKMPTPPLKPFAPTTRTFWAYAIKEQLAKARRFLEDGITLYQIASPILTHESRLGYDDQPYPNRLFVIKSDSLEDELQFRKDLDELLHALHGPHPLDSDYEGAPESST